MNSEIRMGKEDTSRQWRQNAAIIILNHRGQVLLGKSGGVRSYWHFPQGGSLAHESIEETAQRETEEEVGLKSDAYTLVSKIEGARYRYRPGHRRSRFYKGQVQTYFLFKLKNDDIPPLVSGKEFVKLDWFDIQGLSLNLFTPVKRRVIARILKMFFNILVPNELSKHKPQFTKTKYMKTDISPYLIKPGTKVNLNDYDPNDTSLYEGDKASSLAEFNSLREEMQCLQKLLYAENKRRLLVVIQAMDTGGKDGCVRHVFGWLDPQGMNVIPFKKPTEEDLGHDFLWRVHKVVPRAGHITVFNRSHYEDIIAVRVKNIFPKSVWEKRYKNIVNFEELLVDEGTIILKLFLHISKDEQKNRLESRLQDPNKYWKFLPDDLEDRKKWDEFQDVYGDVISRTSKNFAPWYIIPANKKWYRNLVVARLIVQTLRDMKMSYPKVNFDPSKIVIE